MSTTVLSLTTLLGCDRGFNSASDRGAGTRPAGAIGGVVSITIESGGMSRTIEVPDVVDGTTLESVMRSLPPDEVDVNISGRGMTAFVTAIDGRGPEGSRGWVYEIDGEKVMSGIGSTKLVPPTDVRWFYGGMEPESDPESLESE